MMKQTALSDSLLARMGYAVFEDAGGGALESVGTPPAWFRAVYGSKAAANGRFLPGEHSPFLENFLTDAEGAWAAGGDGRTESGAWIERAADGTEVALEAEACVVDGRRILLVANHQQRFDEISRRLQLARDDSLAHERLLREIQTKEVLLHCIVHDLSQPLTALRGCLSLLTMNLPPEKIREVVDIADRQTRKQESMIRDVLKAFSSEVAALQAVAAGQTADVAQGAREVVNEYSAAFASQGVALQLDPRTDQPGDWRAIGEPERLRRIFTNFLENALRYSPAGSVTTVGVEEDGDSLRGFVDDQGPGLPEGVTAAKLFRLFGKGKESTGKAGLGLYFCKITAERWGGSAGCESRAGGGTRFWFRLPRPRGAERTGVVAVVSATPEAPFAKTHERAAPAHADAAPASGAARPLRILLADDLAINRELIVELLARRGHTVHAVENGKDAVQASREREFDLVLLDVEMPGMNGLEAARAIRAGELTSGKRIPILAVTANDSADDREEVRRAGMDGHLLKPFDRERLYRAVEELAASGEPAKPATAQTPPAPEAPLGRDAIVARFGGDSRLASQLAGMFLKDSPRLVAAVRRAAARHDSQGLARAAHALKGAVGHFGALAARAAAARLEDLGKRGDSKGVPQALAELGPAVDELRTVLAGFTRARKSRASGRRQKARK